MALRHRRTLFIVAATIICLGVTGIVIVNRFSTHTQKAAEQKSIPAKKEAQVPPPAPKEAYQGKQTDVAHIFSVKVPDGWRASISGSNSFTAVMFAQPNQLSTLAYAPGTPPTIADGIPAWSGLTEHFFIRAPRTSAQSFNPNDHQEITSQPFTFADGTVGTKYDVIKHAAEAQKWGGLLQGDEWRGQTYIYKKGDVQVEAHLALYPSSNVDVVFYESVIKSITTK